MTAALGLLAAALFARWARRQAPRSRALALLPPRGARDRAHPLQALWQRRRHQRLVRAELPVAVEMVRVAVAAGQTPLHALATVAPWAPPRVGAALAGAVTRCGLGVGVADSLDQMAASEPALSGLARVLRSSGDLGASIESALAALGRDTRTAVRRDAEARARTVPVRLLFPLVFLVLPAFGLLGVAPSVIAGFR